MPKKKRLLPYHERVMMARAEQIGKSVKRKRRSKR